MQRYFIIYKPYQVLSQFSFQPDKKGLTDYFNVPKDVYPVGRLDYDSEGLLILTNDTQLNHLLLNPDHKHEREYWVQVEGDINKEAIETLQKGVTISINGKQHKTLPCNASIFEEDPKVAERVPSIRFRKEIPARWIRLLLIEGKNRQVRRMTAKVGFPTLRLIRYRIEAIALDNIQPGDMRELSKQDVYKRLFG